MAECFLEHPEDGLNAKQLDAITFLDYCTHCDKSPAIANFANGLARAFLGVEACELSGLFMINYIKGGTGLANLASDEEDGAQYIRARQGMPFVSLFARM